MATAGQSRQFEPEIGVSIQLTAVSHRSSDNVRALALPAGRFFSKSRASLCELDLNAAMTAAARVGSISSQLYNDIGTMGHER